jgi:hypothetical protein
MSTRRAVAWQFGRILFSCVLTGLPLSVAAVGQASNLTATFDMPAPAAPPPGSAPWATLNLNLNPDHTISGWLSLTQGFTTSTFCFNVVGPSAGFEIAGLPAGWFGNDTGSPLGCGTTSFGTFNSYISSGDGSNRAGISFTVERDGGFSSVYDLVELSFFGTPRVDFTTDVFSGSTIGVAGAIAPTPEPPSAVLLMTGLFGILIGLGKALSWKRK